MNNAAEQQIFLDSFLTRLGEGAFARALLAAAGENLIIIDDNGQCLFGGAHAAGLLGHTPTELLGCRLPELIADGATSPFRLRRKDGAAIALTGQITRLHDEGHTVAGAIVLLTAASTDGDARSRLPDTHVQVLEESNHRVRNNLAMICALLDMEMMQAPEGERHRLLVSLARTRSLALPHNLVADASGMVEVGMLTRAVIDSVRSLFERITRTVTVISPHPVLLDIRRATYLALALTELVVHLLQCCAHNDTPDVPRIRIEGTPEKMTLTLAETSCMHDGACQLLAPLSREILVGLVERSLGGQLELPDASPFRTVIHCPL